MLLYVTKRDKRRRTFNQKHIYSAIEAAFKDSGEKFTSDALDNLVSGIVDSLSSGGSKSVHVEKIQDAIEKALMTAGFLDTAKAFITFRAERTRIRDLDNELNRRVREIIDANLKTSSLLRDNGNVNGALVASSMAKAGGETMKLYNLLDMIRPEIARAHKNGDIHIHDLDYYSLTVNCFFIPLDRMLRDGFDTGNGWVRPAKSIETACAIAAIALQTSQNAFFGGQAFADFDFYLAPYVNMSFQKNLKLVIRNAITSMLAIDGKLSPELEAVRTMYDLRVVKDTCVKSLGDIVGELDEYECGSEKLPELHYNEYDRTYVIPTGDGKTWTVPAALVNEADEMTVRNTMQGLESFVHNVNSLFSRSGNQLPFSSVNFGLDISKCGRLVSLALLNATHDGIGNHDTAIFPISICKEMAGYTINPGDPNYDIWELSCEVCAERFYPNFVNVDAPFNKVYVKYDEKSVPFSEKDVVDARGKKVYRVAPGEFWEYVSDDGKEATVRRLRHETTIATMGCADGRETVKLESGVLTFIDAWKKLSEEYPVKEYSEKTQFIDLDRPDIEEVKVFDTELQDFVKCKKIIRNIEVCNWLVVRFDNGKELLLTDDHPLYLETRGRTFARDCKPGDRLKYLDTVATITEVEFLRRIADSYDVETASDRFELSGFNSGNCRTRSIGNVNGESVTAGKGNLWFTTINLPAIAIRASKTKNPVDAFWKELDEKLVMCRECMEDRYRTIKNRTYANLYFPMKNGLYMNSDKNAPVSTTIESVIKNGSSAIGYIGIYETCLTLLDKVFGVDDEATKLGYEIVKHIREYTDAVQKETHMNWTTFASPAENVCGRFAQIDKKRFGQDPGLKVHSDELWEKGYYTNSHMMPFDVKTTLQHKLEIETPFHELTNGGHIFYYKIDGDPSKNVEAVKRAVRAMYDANVGYGTITFSQDTCRECGYRGIIDDECPHCHSKDNGSNVLRIRRITGYLVGRSSQSIEESWGDGKLAELKRRVNI